MSRFYGPLLLCLAVFLLANICLVSCRDATAVKRKYDDVRVLEDETTSEDGAVVERKTTVTTDASRMTWNEILNKFGVNIPNYVVDLLDHANDMFEEHTKDSGFNAGNAVIAALKAAFRRTLEPAMRASSRPQGTLEPVTVDELFDVMQSNFLDIMSNSPHVTRSRIKPYVSKYVGDFFKSLKDMYRGGYAVGLSINWTMIFIVMPYFDLLPTEVFMRDSFAEFLQVPGQLKQSLHDFLEDMLSGDQAHFIRMILSFVQTIDWQKMLRGRDEL